MVAPVVRSLATDPDLERRVVEEGKRLLERVMEDESLVAFSVRHVQAGMQSVIAEKMNMAPNTASQLPWKTSATAFQERRFAQLARNQA